MKNIYLYCCIFLAANIMTCLSIFYTHPSNEIAQYGNLCPIEQWMNCYRPRLSAGFPFVFYFDTPGVSVENQIDFLVDEFRLYPFMLDSWIYFLILLFSYKLLSSSNFSK